MTDIHRETDFILICTQCRFQFALAVEHPTDITVGKMRLHELSKHDQGYALYRERSFVLCPKCKSYCRLLPGSLSVEVKYTPDETAKKNQA